jgi:translocation and assembly module TamA
MLSLTRCGSPTAVLAPPRADTAAHPIAANRSRPCGFLVGLLAVLVFLIVGAAGFSPSAAAQGEPAPPADPAALTDPTPGVSSSRPRPAAPVDETDSSGEASSAARARAGARRVNYQLQIESPPELTEALRTRTLLGRWREDPDFSAEQLPLFVTRGQEEALAIAQAAGFFSASAVVTLIERVSSADIPTVRIVVDAGARTTVAGFTLTVAGAAQGTPIERKLASDWPLSAGTFFRTAEWDLGKRLLIEALQSQGYLRARISDSKARVDAELTSAVLSVTVDSGPRLQFGPLVVKGLSRYPRSIVDDLRPFREGDPYTLDEALLFQQRLRGTPQFASATVLPDLTAIEGDPNLVRVPVMVELAERQQQRVTGGLGYSTDQGARGLIGYEHRNLRDRGWSLESGLLLESLRTRGFATVRTPQDDKGHYWQGGLRIESLDTLGEFTRTQTAYVGRGTRSEVADHFVSLQYQTEASEIDAGEGQRTRDRRAALTLGWAWSLRRLDSRVDPRDGYTISTQLSGAVKGLGSDRSFVRLYGRAMRFWPMPVDSKLAGGILIGLVEAGWVISQERGDIPSQNLFRAGGAQSVRGYRYLGLGLKQGDAIVGGRVLALGSIEYQHPVTGNWYGAAFVDVGNVVDEVSQWRPAVGYGVGVRWRSPIGPINLDVAYGERDRRVRAHFSVGYSF